MKPCLKPKRTGQRTRRVDKDRTAAAVLEAIQCISTVPVETIDVTVHQGWVRLEGVLPAWSQKEMVDNIVRQVPGVKGLISLISVNPLQPKKRTRI